MAEACPPLQVARNAVTLGALNSKRDGNEHTKRGKEGRKEEERKQEKAHRKKKRGRMMTDKKKW